jgi:hypothetical protein
MFSCYAPFECFRDECGVLCSFGAKISGERHCSNSTKVKAVSVPASLHSDVSLSHAIAVIRHRITEEGESPVIDVEKLAAEVMRGVACAKPVLRINSFIDSYVIVEQGEEAHYIGSNPALTFSNA